MIVSFSKDKKVTGSPYTFMKTQFLNEPTLYWFSERPPWLLHPSYITVFLLSFTTQALGWFIVYTCDFPAFCGVFEFLLSCLVLALLPCLALPQLFLSISIWNFKQYTTVVIPLTNTAMMTSSSSEDLTSGFYDDEPTHWFSCFSPFLSLFGKCTCASGQSY